MIYDILLVLILLSVIIGWIYILFRWNKQVRWLFTPLIWLKNMLDVNWWSEILFYKLKLDRLADNPWRRWVESLPMKKRIALELFVFVPILILLDEYVLMPYLGVAVLPWNWDWSAE